MQFHFSKEVVSIQEIPEILMGAGIAGNYNLFKMIFDKWGKDRGYWYEIFRCACQGGNRDIMDLCYHQDVDEGLIGAFFFFFALQKKKEGIIFWQNILLKKVLIWMKILVKFVYMLI